MRPFPYPLPPEALQPFLHPRAGHPLSAPGLDPEGNTIAANGFLALRVETFLPDIPPASPELLTRVARLPWARLEKLEGSPWRPLDDAAPQLFRFGPKPVWKKSPVWGYSPAPTVRVGAAAVAQVATIQLLSRLPRAQVWTDSNFGDFLFFKFNRGAAILAPWDQLLTPSFTILKPRQDPFTKAFLFPS